MVPTDGILGLAEEDVRVGGFPFRRCRFAAVRRGLGGRNHGRMGQFAPKNCQTWSRNVSCVEEGAAGIDSWDEDDIITGVGGVVTGDGVG